MRIAAGVTTVFLTIAVAVSFGGVDPASAQTPTDGRQDVREGVADLLEAVVVRLEHRPAPDVGDAGLLDRYRAAVMAAFMLIAPIVLVAAVCAVAGASPGRLVRMVLGRLPVAVIVTVAAIALVRLWFELVDDLTAVWTGGAGGGLATALEDVAGTLRQPVGAASAFLGSVASVLAGSAALAIWLELVLRDAVVYMCLAFLPLTLVSTLLPATMTWMRRLVAVLALAAATPLIITVILDAGLAAMPATGVGGYEAVMYCAGVMAVAAAGPFLAFRFLRSPGGRERGPSVAYESPGHVAPPDAAALDPEAHGRLALTSATNEEPAP